RRDDAGHFAGSQEAFRHWDEDGMVEAGCATCHSARGLPFFLDHEVQIEQPLSNGLACETCHNDLEAFTTFEIEQVTFPSGAQVTLEDQSNLCLTCHQGRSFGGTVDRATADLPADEPAELRFINIHYFAAGATLFGNEVQGAYQYPDKTYVGRFEHVDPYNTCVECHNVHALTVNEEDCTVCHPVEEMTEIRMGDVDYDGDGDTEEGIANEIATLTEALYAAMQDYGTSTEGVGAIEYNAARYPYFFNDAGESFASWTPTLLKAAYNYQYVQKDPGAFAHNAEYIIQVLYDSIESLGGDVSGFTRPEAEE
ncbi:MAG: polyheme membrane-associated cytochrome C, partial [Anaerolineae bacterium]|nr:polyheme membrane-associated cytochrome C [Anaerolineae bacterium]